MQPTKNALRKVRHQRVRARVIGTQEKPRLSVFRSLRGMNVQIIDDSTGKTLCAVSHSEVKGKKVDKKVGQSAMIGEMIAQKANVHRLLLGHFSSRYDKLDAFLEEAQTVFPNTSLAVDGMSFSIEE